MGISLEKEERRLFMRRIRKVARREKWTNWDKSLAWYGWQLRSNYYRSDSQLELVRDNEEPERPSAPGAGPGDGGRR